jgi:D-alanyl-D-alanine dipeptidase
MSMTFETEPRDTVLVRIHDVVPDLLTDVRYATSDNFTKRILYTSDTLYARRAMAEQLLVAQRDARSRGLQLKVYDAYRPLSIQRLMWSIIPDERYVADPAKGSRHNRGCALDLTLCDSTGVELEMGTGYDEFTERAAATYMDLPERILANRRLLEQIMNAAGFDVLPSEWWHFDLRGWENYAILNE